MDITIDEDYEICNQSINLVEKVFNISKKFPFSDQEQLISQVKRFAVYIPSNITEGLEKYNKNDFIQFFDIALDYMVKLDKQLKLWQKIGYINNYKEFESELNNIKTKTIKLKSLLKKNNTELANF